MPITVKDYSWKETEAEVDIVLPLKGVKASKADILSTERYIKVNYPPYLFEVYLHAEVIEEQCTARVGNGVIEFRLVKREVGLWGSLGSKETEDKHVLGEKRAEAVEKVRRVTAEQAKARAKKKREEEQFAIREQMKLEQEQRERIEAEKQRERDQANKELQRWKEEKRKKEEEQQQKREPARRLGCQVASKKASKTTTKVSSSAIWKTTESGKTSQEVETPAPRRGGSIQVHFTARAFPTAARESMEAEEQEWLAKQAAARRITHPGEGEEGDVNERNPEFLKDRGIDFFQARNYEAAVNVFSEAVALNPALPQLFANRAACYLAMRKLDKCISDCCRALELYYPVVPSNQAARAKVFARRGSAYSQSNQLHLAVQDYEAAVALVPGDERLRDDLTRLKQAELDSEQS